MNPLHFSRRRFLQAGILAGSGLALLGATASVHATTGQFEKSLHRIQVQSLPAELHGLRIGFLSDVHLSLFYPNEWFEQALRSLDQECDLLLLGGDYLWIPDRPYQWQPWVPRNPAFANLKDPELPARIYHAAAQMIETIAPPLGVVGCLGNHDRWSRSSVCATQFGARNIRVAVNEWVTIQRGNSALHIWSTDDYWNGLPALPSDTRSPSILLTHNPDFVNDSRKEIASRFDLVLAGHTHGGQIKLPYLGAMTYGIRHRPFGEGLIALSDRCTLFVSRGLGMVELPFRISCPGETSVIELSSL